jgi:hypothetical protein
MKLDHDTVRFCRHCNTELFFLERFAPEEPKKPSKFKERAKRLKADIHAVFTSIKHK